MDIHGVVIDLDGTVYRGGDPLPGAPGAVERLRDGGRSLLFLSNNPTKTRAAYVDRLAGMGIAATAEEILSAGTVTAEYLAEHHAGDALLVVGDEGFREQLRAAGLAFTDDPDEADVLVASWDREFDYDTMCTAIETVDADTAFVGSDPDRLIPAGDDRFVPGSGAVINAIEGVVGREADVVLGKPSAETVAAAQERLSVPPDRCLLVGDRLDTDIAMGERAGMTTVLVLTGVSERADVADADVTPDHVVESLADVPDLLE